MKVKIAVSGCLIGTKCNFNGTDLLSQFVFELQKNDQIELVPFCPEDSIFGTPRPNLRIVGGDGFDVLDGHAKVIDENGLDVTSLQIDGANLFLKHIKSAGLKYAILMDGSPSCGSNVLLAEENWPAGGFKRGVGVAAALLKRNQFNVFSNFDLRSISELLAKIVDGFESAPNLLNLSDMPKFKKFFESTPI